MPNFISISQNNVVIWPFFNVSRWRPSAIINFLKFKILTANMAQRLNMHHRDKFCANRSNHRGDMAIFIFQYGGRQPSWIFQYSTFLTAHTTWRMNIRRHAKLNNKQVRPSSGTAVYPHMPILHPHAVRISTVTFKSAHVYVTTNRTSL